MSFLSRVFGAKAGAQPPASGDDIESQLRELEREARDAGPGYVGTAYNKAGDIALRAGSGDRAVTYYGQAIDSFLQDGQREAARGVANKIIRVRPRAVRTLCTLTWLDLAARHLATALLHLREYAEAAKGAGQQAIAADQICEMARTVPDSEFHVAAAGALESLGFSDRAADLLRERAEEEDGEGRRASAARRGEHELEQACLQSAVRSNEREDPKVAREREQRRTQARFGNT